MTTNHSLSRVLTLCTKREAKDHYYTTWPDDSFIGRQRMQTIARPHVIRNRACVMGYDIESEHDGYGLPTPAAKITCASLWCTCGEVRAWHVDNGEDIESSYAVLDSENIVLRLVTAVIAHAPGWLVGYNCYSYDNPALMWHAPVEYRHMFKSVRAPRNNFACYIDIPNVANADCYLYLDKVHRSSYPSLGLRVVAQTLGLPPKMTPTQDTSSPHYMRDMVEYNIRDSQIAALAWCASGSEQEVVTLLKVFRCHLQDAVRYNTGVMTSCLVAHEADARGLIMDYGKCDPVKFEGGLVQFVRHGVFYDVSAVDFNSMYPSITMGANISIETISLHNVPDKEGMGSLPAGKVYWNAGGVTVTHPGSVAASFSRSTPGIICEVMAKVVRQRKAIPKSDPLNAGLKVAANSMYGVVGFVHSPSYSPYVAASITSIGRWVLTASQCIAVGLGFNVIYGDTDSLMVTPNTKDPSLTPLWLTSIIDKVMSYTFLGDNLKLGVQGSYECMGIVSAKRYVLRHGDGTVVAKGLDSVRKDRLRVASLASGHLMEIITARRSLLVKMRLMALYITDVMAAVYSHTLPLSLVSYEKRQESTVMLCYKALDGYERSLSLDVLTATHDPVVKYNRAHVINAVDKSCQPIVRMLGFRNIEHLMKMVFMTDPRGEYNAAIDRL